MKVHEPVPACVTVTVCPAIVSVPVRVPDVVFASTLYVTVPLPVPLPPPVTVIQPVLLLTALQAHPLVVVTDAV